MSNIYLVEFTDDTRTFFEADSLSSLYAKMRKIDEPRMVNMIFKKANYYELQWKKEKK